MDSITRRTPEVTSETPTTLDEADYCTPRPVQTVQPTFNGISGHGPEVPKTPPFPPMDAIAQFIEDDRNIAPVTMTEYAECYESPQSIEFGQQVTIQLQLQWAVNEGSNIWLAVRTTEGTTPPLIVMSKIDNNFNLWTASFQITDESLWLRTGASIEFVAFFDYTLIWTGSAFKLRYFDLLSFDTKQRMTCSFTSQTPLNTIDDAPLAEIYGVHSLTKGLHVVHGQYELHIWENDLSNRPRNFSHWRRLLCTHLIAPDKRKTKRRAKMQKQRSSVGEATEL